MSDNMWKTSQRLKTKIEVLRRHLSKKQSAHPNDVNVCMLLVHNENWSLRMAIKKAQGKEAPKKAEFRGFFNYDLSEDEKGGVKAFIGRDEDVGIAIETALSDGYKLTITRNDANETFIATMQSYDPKSENAGLCMSAFGKHWFLAIGVLMYKHEKCLGKRWEKNGRDTINSDFG